MVWVWVVYTFALGAGVGSFLNLLVSRLPLERSAIWPLCSRCLNCYQKIRLTDNLPLISYLRLGGRCRTCHAPYSPRYFIVELLTAIGFAGLFYLIVMLNWYGVPMFRQEANAIWQFGVVPWQAWVMFGVHAILFSFLMVAAFCDIARREIPISVTMTGVVFGLIVSTVLPWPWPLESLIAQRLPPGEAWFGARMIGKIPLGMMPWPAWGPTPFAAGSWELGLCNGLIGAIAGLVMIRLIRFFFSTGLGREALGLGDADLMMMAGAFLGWQIIIIAFFVGTVVMLLIMIPIIIIRGVMPFAFGPGLALGVMITWISWPALGPRLQFVLFDPWMMGPMAVVLLFGSFVGARILRRPVPQGEN